MKDGFEEAAVFGLGGGELRFQPVTQGHQFIHFGNDAVLFGKGREEHEEVAKRSKWNCWLSSSSGAPRCLLVNQRRRQQ